MSIISFRNKMKTLNNNIIYYDEDCPLCQAYTSTFVKTKMLDFDGRKPFGKITREEQHFIDIERASNEIALMDTESKTVTYGLDSLLKIIGFSFPWVEKMGKTKPMGYILKKIYAFISYNRKVIVPSKLNNENKLQCIPKFNMSYRMLYILFAAVITVLVLFDYSSSFSFISESSIVRESTLVIGQILFQGILIVNLKKKEIIDYLGNLMTVSLMGSIILSPILLIGNFLLIPETMLLIWFGIAATIMFIEHGRRIKLLKLPNILTYTWVLYRIIILLLIMGL